MTNLFTNLLQKVVSSLKLTKLTKLTEQIFVESAESAKSAKPIFATSATFASANFVGKESNESTEMYRVKSRIPSFLFRYSLDSHHSRSVCSPRTPSLFKAKSQLAFPQFSLASLICLCMLTVGVGNVWADIDLRGKSSALTIPLADSESSYEKGDWRTVGAPTSDGSATCTITQSAVTYGTISLTHVADALADESGGYPLQFTKGSGTVSFVIKSDYGVDVVVRCKSKNSNEMTLNLTGASQQYAGTSWGTNTLSTTNTSATLSLASTSEASKACGITYIKITPKAGASCSSTTPSATGAASLNGSFNMTSTTSAIGVTTSSWNPGSNCSWSEYGFVWSDGETTTNPTVDNNKVKVGESGTGASWNGNVTPSGSTTPNTWTTGHTYYVKAYGKNNNGSATIAYGSSWSFTPRSVTFKANGGTGSDKVQYVQGGVSTALSANTFTKTGYTFNGWNTNSDGTSGTGYTEGQSVNLGADIILFAKWQAKTTTVSFNQTSGTGGQTGTLTATYGSAMPSAPVTVPTRDGYDFGGYYDGSGGTGTQYYTNTGASARTWNKEDATYTLHAKWTVKSFTVTWMVNGVAYTTGDPSNSVDFGTHVSKLPTAPTPPCGNKFMGWTTTNIGATGQATDAGLNLFTTAEGAPTISAEGPVTYYAVFADYGE